MPGSTPTAAPATSRARRRPYLRSVALAASLIALIQPGDSRARDLEKLARVLIPAYMGRHFAGACLPEDPSFLDATSSSSMHVYLYAKHLNEEVWIDLSRDEVERIVRMATETAGTVARDELRNLATGTLTTEAENLRSWCDRSAKPFVRRIIDTHFEKHEEVEAIIARAKND